MAGFGITGLIQVLPDGGTKPITKARGGGQPPIPMWVGNTFLPMTKVGKDLTNFRETPAEFIRRLSRLGILVTQRIDGFISNGKTTRCSELYPRKEDIGYNACFLKINNALLLMCIGSKNAEEFVAAGHDFKGRSRVPLLISVTRDQHGRKLIDAINLLPQPTHLLREVFKKPKTVEQPKETPKEESDGTQED